MSRKPMSDMGVLKEMILSDANSRRDLGKKLGVSKAAITQVVSRLLELGLVEEGLSVEEARRGRKAISLNVKNGITYFLGTDIEGLSIRTCILDCGMNIVASRQCAIGPDWTVKKILKRWQLLIDEVLEVAQIKLDKIASIGIGLPGKVAQNGNFSSRAILPPGRWVDFNASFISEKYKRGTSVANNVFCVAEYERRLGIAQGADNFMAVVIRYGVGAAIFANGAYITGKEFLAGELGHMRIKAGGPTCVCGQTGCLDTLVSGRTWPDRQTASDGSIRRQLSKRAKYLAIGLGNLFKVVHLPLLIIDGIYNDYTYYFEPKFTEALKQELKGLSLPLPEIVFGNTVQFKSSIGAAMLAADAFLQDHLEGMLHG